MTEEKNIYSKGVCRSGLHGGQTGWHLFQIKNNYSKQKSKSQMKNEILNTSPTAPLPRSAHLLLLPKREERIFHLARAPAPPTFAVK
jgi:hypothetical protein